MSKSLNNIAAMQEDGFVSVFSVCLGLIVPEVALHLSVTVSHVCLISFVSFTTRCAETSQGDTSYP